MANVILHKSSCIGIFIDRRSSSISAILLWQTIRLSMGFLYVIYIVSSKRASDVLISEIYLARPVPMVVADSAMIQKSRWEPAL